VDEWRDTSERAVEYGRIPLTDGELLPEGALDGEPPDEKRLTEASGNEGASYERSYHRAALVLWRQDRYAEVLLQAGAVAGLPYLKRLIASGKRARPEALAVSERMVKAWSADSQPWDSYAVGGGRPGPTHRIEMLASLRKLNAAALLERFVRDTVTSSYDGSENAALLSSVSVLGEPNAMSINMTVALRGGRWSRKISASLPTSTLRSRVCSPGMRMRGIERASPPRRYAITFQAAPPPREVPRTSLCASSGAGLSQIP
jgi:hypothetical protein